MNLRLQAPTARHLGVCTLFAPRHSVHYACVAHPCARPDLAHIWRFRFRTFMNSRGYSNGTKPIVECLRSSSQYSPALCNPAGVATPRNIPDIPSSSRLGTAADCSPTIATNFSNTPLGCSRTISGVRESCDRLRVGEPRPPRTR